MRRFRLKGANIQGHQQMSIFSKNSHNLCLHELTSCLESFNSVTNLHKKYIGIIN
jgi:hypothetical protein